MKSDSNRAQCPKCNTWFPGDVSKLIDNLKSSLGNLKADAGAKTEQLDRANNLISQLRHKLDMRFAHNNVSSIRDVMPLVVSRALGNQPEELRKWLSENGHTRYADRLQPADVQF